MIFSSICEELGVIFGICLILVCVSCFIMIMEIAMGLKDKFCRLAVYGLGIMYIFQIFLNVGGVTKFIPSTGVTLPFISYGGSSIVSSFLIMGVMQGLYIMGNRTEEVAEDGQA